MKVNKESMKNYWLQNKCCYNINKCGPSNALNVLSTFLAYVCQMCAKYAKAKYEIIKHYKKI